MAAAAGCAEHDERHRRAVSFVISVLSAVFTSYKAALGCHRQYRSGSRAIAGGHEVCSAAHCDRATAFSVAARSARVPVSCLPTVRCSATCQRPVAVAACPSTEARRPAPCAARPPDHRDRHRRLTSGSHRRYSATRQRPTAPVAYPSSAACSRFAPVASRRRKCRLRSACPGRRRPACSPVVWTVRSGRRPSAASWWAGRAVSAAPMLPCRRG